MFVPSEGDFLVVDLPGERTRATVDEVKDKNTVIVLLTSMPMAKSHMYRMDERVRCKRSHNGFQEIWEAVKHEPNRPAPPPVIEEPPRRQQRASAGKGR